MRVSRILGLAILLLLVSVPALAALPPKAYQELRDKAPFAFAGTVVMDPGGKALVRVESVDRGDLKPGDEVTVSYPEYESGMEIPSGAAVYYDRFHPGDRIKVWGSGTGKSIAIVHKGIDIIESSGAPYPESSPWPWVAAGAILAGAAAALYRWRRRRGRAAA